MDDGGNRGLDSNSTDPGKMFIGGLHSKTEEEGLQRYFEKFGAVKECVVMRDAVTKRSRGFGFVKFVDPKSVEQVQNSVGHALDGKKIDPKRAVPKRVPPQNQDFKKVFVGGLPPDIKPQEVKEYFETFGKVMDCILMHDRNTKRLRGFGFVTFEADASGQHVCETGFHKLKGKNVECKKALPKDLMPLQGKGKGFLVNLTPYPLSRGYHNTVGTSPLGFNFPDWSLSPQVYQQLATAYASNYVPQGFLNMPDHRRSYGEIQPSSTSTQSAVQHQTLTSNNPQNSIVTTDVLNAEYNNLYSNNVQFTPFGSQHTPVVTPASPLTQGFSQQQTTSPRLDLNGYLTRAEHLYHNGHPASSQPQGGFGHGLTTITLRH